MTPFGLDGVDHVTLMLAELGGTGSVVTNSTILGT